VRTKLTKEEFIERATIIHKNKYDYSLVNYVNAKTKVKIICQIHGVFEQLPKNHTSLKQNCPTCGKNQRTLNQKTNTNFIKQSKIVHDGKYDYSLVDYKNNKSKVKIICTEHGIFEQQPSAHLRKAGCSKCANCKKFSNEEFISKSNFIHNNKYDYKLVKYKNIKTKVKLLCPEHGKFKQSPEIHLNGSGCPKCGKRIQRLKRIKEISINQYNGNQIIPSFNKKACKLFDNISKEKNTHIQHAMNGGEYYIKELGYWVDGYDKENNTVYEFDEKHHFTVKQQKKDKIRQKEIINLLECKFIRIKDK